MSQPLVSVVIPVYNGAAFLREALQSVFAQDYAACEVIVVDDGSTDDSVACARAFPGVRVETQANQGNAAARNRGIALARGEFVALIDQDDVWRPEKLRRQVEALQAQPAAGFSLCHAILRLEPGMTLPPAYNATAFAGAFPAYFPSALMLRRATFARVGPFDPAYRSGNDSDWILRAKDAGEIMAMLPEVLLEKRVHAANQGHDIPLMKHDLMRVLRSSILRKRAAQPGAATRA
jgi:glycosyltransferase involved in cell wall biosynthesis